MKRLFTNARLIDPEAGTDSPGALLIDGDRIAQVFATPTPEVTADEVIDAVANAWPPASSTSA